MITGAIATVAAAFVPGTIVAQGSRPEPDTIRSDMSSTWNMGW